MENHSIYPATGDYPRKPIAVLDIETDGLGGAYIFGGYMLEGDDTLHPLPTAESCVDAIFKHRGYTWYAHNGGEYDYQYLLPALLDAIEDRGCDVTPIVRGGRTIIGFTIREGHHKYELRDSYALIPLPLREVAATYAPEFQKGDIGIKNGTTFDPTQPAHMAYLLYDLLGLKYALLAFDQLLFGQLLTHPRWSASGTALLAWRQTLDRAYRRNRPANR
jgi:hypothetical protein